MRFYVMAILILVMAALGYSSSLGTEANVNFGYGGSTFTTPCAETGSVAVCSGSAPVTGTSLSMNYDAYGVANTYGVLGAYAQGSLTAASPTSGTVPVLGNINSQAWFIDSFAFTGTDSCGGVPCAASGDGTVVMQFLVTGTDADSPNAFGRYCMDVLPGSDSADINCNVYALQSSAEVLSQPLPISFGVASTFTVGFDVYGHITSFTGTNPGFTANFADTSVLAGFEVFDSSGEQLTSFNVTSASGTAYPNGTVPEPSAFLLALISLAVLAIGWPCVLLLGSPPTASLRAGQEEHATTLLAGIRRKTC